MSIDQMYEILKEYNICTQDEIALVTAINGENEKSYLDMLCVRTGYHNFDQLIDDLNN